jgi:SAM-dependent methyltransferase
VFQPILNSPDLAETVIQELISRLDTWRPTMGNDVLWRQLDALVPICHQAVQASSNPTEALTRAQRRLHPYFLQAPNLHRAWHKPRGYAGDAGLMDLGYRNRAEGETPLGRALHQWFSLLHGATSVRARRRWILLQMQAHGRAYPDSWRAMSLASGTAWELRDVIAESFLARTGRFLCVDQDREALREAEAALADTAAEHGRTLDVCFEESSVRALLKGTWSPPEQDFIYSLGLFDYLEDRVAMRLLAVLADRLAPGGQLIVGNYLPENDARPTMELLLDWHLVYRTQQEVEALAAGLPVTIESEIDATGSMTFLRLTRGGKET